ncbi:hypothetical protein ACFQ71_40275 [Streptomyces sp. NPDC056534]|uniref:hypothetical protein n=1 Tax=Streptomyces sp. NPDC056534 TaxID=3345857 RepID=UPI0036BDB164
MAVQAPFESCFAWALARRTDQQDPPAPGPAQSPGTRLAQSRGNRAYLYKRRIMAVIPEKKDQASSRKNKGRRGGRPVTHDACLHKERNTVERLINKLKAG